MKRLCLALTLGLASALSGCDDGGGLTAAFDAGPDDTGARDAGPADVVFVRDSGPRDVVVNTNPLVVGVIPDHGPFNGGNQVLVRGANFTEEALVQFGEALAQPRDTEFVDRGRLRVVPPSGRPGEVDVTVEVNGRRAVLPRGYRYDAFYADPTEGSTGGGTFISIRGLGTGFTDATNVTIDDQPCRQIRVVGPEELNCVTPAHIEGRVPITIQTGASVIRVEEAFNYTDGGAEASRGGLGGGPIQGNIGVTVIAGNTGDPIPNALVYVGSDPYVSPPLSARTNDRGRATVSGENLRGPVSLTVSARCFNSHTVQVFDARNVTLYLYAQMIPACASGSPPSGGGGRGVFGASVSGELVWEGPNEFAPNPWRNVPAPRSGERRVAYVYATQTDILSQPREPGDGNVVLEIVTPGYGGRGYPFTIATRPSGLAIYAIAGVENIRTQRFTPYIMGVARGVLASPRAAITNVVVNMNIPLDHRTEVEVSNLPGTVGGLPDRIRVEAFVDLGGEGVIARPEISVVGRDESDRFSLVALPAFTGQLADARLIVRGLFSSGEYYTPPSSVIVVGGITSPDDTVRLRDWVGIPNLSSPVENGRLAPDRAVRFSVDGASPDMWSVNLSGDVLYWQTFARGTERAFFFPDISRIDGLTDLPQGTQLYMSINGIRTPGFDFDNFRYTYLSLLYWTAYSTRTVLFQR